MPNEAILDAFGGLGVAVGEEVGFRGHRARAGAVAPGHINFVSSGRVFWTSYRVEAKHG